MVSCFVVVVVFFDVGIGDFNSLLFMVLLLLLFCFLLSVVVVVMVCYKMTIGLINVL